MELLGQQTFEHHHITFVVGNLDRGCFDDQTFEGSLDQDLGKLVVVGIVVVEFEALDAKVIIRQDYSPNQNSLEPVVNR